MDRRRLLTLLAAGTAAALTGGGVAHGDPLPLDTGSTGGWPFESLPGLPSVGGAPKTPIGPGTLSALPGAGNSLALTIDDGASAETVGAFIDFAYRTGARLTFFVTAYYPSWSVHRDALRPLVDSGQVQLGNHSWDHPYLTKLTEGQIADQLERAKAFLYNTFGTDGTPYFRPPYGSHNATVDRVAADVGYTVPVLWSDTLGDTATVVTADSLIQNAERAFAAQSIVLGHANRPTITQTYNQLTDIIRERSLSLVTLNDVLLPPR